jgi:hypothetical protein
LIPVSEIGIVIQGPIQSFGRVLTDLAHRAYDCTDDVKKMIRESIEVGVTPIVSTWSDQKLESFSENEKNFIFQISFPQASLSNSLFNDWNKNSKYRQYYSTLIGLQKLKSSNCKYVLKVRTDNNVDIRSLIHFVTRLSESEAERFVYTPLINLDKPHMFYDFYTFSSVAKLEEFCNVMLYEKEITTNIHFDVFYRWTKHVMKSRFTLRDLLLIYPNYPRFTSSQLKLIRFGLSDVFRPLPKGIWTNLYWRGEQLQEQGLKAQYRFAEVPMREVLDEFDQFDYKMQNMFNVKILSIPSFFLNSRVEVNLCTLAARFKGAVRKLTQFLRKIINGRQKPSI